MKYGKEWVLKTAQCPDGTAWGLEYVTEGAKTLKEALLGFHRADWLLWYLVKTDSLAIECAFDLCLELIQSRLDLITPEDFLSLTPQGIAYRRGKAAMESENLTTRGELKSAHGQMAACFLYRFKLQLLEVDHDEALKDGQCVLNNLVAAKTGSLNFLTVEAKEEHEGLCDWLRSRVRV